MLALVCVWSWSTLPNGFCSFKAALNATRDENATVYLEFLINIYRILIAGLLSLIAALFAAYPV